ncbi:polysaccharide deacetylase family protein [Noviherbaspirillum sp. UKPF54]|uniref:polysaccharide deacetylase family protein n=1 Tax=Noviherbaspirillum sp. UKPF54 TaxID=2601898 RepID=UPI0011B124E1|nr:polysaccharide deacetylase family protein [Noviherbaspirillum sp. UKPF54]QDZ28999.1 polysaccharide deacetylase family protein [Noviherbaspirillum sp. UKPF54]
MRLSPLRSLLGRSAPAGKDARLSILIYHRVLREPDPLFPLEVDTTTFDRQMRLLAEFFNVLPLREAVGRLHSGQLPPRAACVTFDDGYADNAELAFPILKKHGIPATFFIATGFLDGGRMWNDSVIELVRRCPVDSLDLHALGLGILPTASWDQRAESIGRLLQALKYLPLDERMERVEAMRELMGIALPASLMMSSQQVKMLDREGMEIGAHTVNHPILATLDRTAARREIADSRDFLEALLRVPVKSFAYPNGKPQRDYLAEQVGIVKDLRFELAVSTGWGTARNGTDTFQLPRFTPWDRNDTKFLLRMLCNMHAPVEAVPYPASSASTVRDDDPLFEGIPEQ